MFPSTRKKLVASSLLHLLMHHVAVYQDILALSSGRNPILAIADVAANTTTWLGRGRGCGWTVPSAAAAGAAASTTATTTAIVEPSLHCRCRRCYGRSSVVVAGGSTSLHRILFSIEE
jgi:hypothetical protein